MAIKGYMESSLANSEIFKGICDSAENDPRQQSIKLIQTAKLLTNEDIEAAYISVRQITDSLTRAAMKAFDDGRTVLVYNNVPALSVTQALPFITYRRGDKYVTYVFVDKYVTMSRDGVLTMQAPILRDLLTGALVANGLKTSYSILASSQHLQKFLMEVYTKLVTRIINRLYSVAAERNVWETIQFWINKFFLTRILVSTDSPENINKISSEHFRYVDEMMFDDMKRQYDEADPQSISDLLNLVKTASPRMKALSLGTFLGDWINYYYVPSMLAIDNVEYLIFMCLTLLSGNNIINISAGDIVKESKNLKNFRSELLKLI